MTSYFEKLASINASSLSLLQQATANTNSGGAAARSVHTSSNSSTTITPVELNQALDRIEELKRLNNKLELDLKCEHDEKADLVSLKVGLENEVLNLREVNERLEFQVEQLRVEKDKIHNVLARVREEASGNAGVGPATLGLFIAGGGNMKKYPSLDDLSAGYSPSTSPTPPPLQASRSPGNSTITLEKINEEDETLLESLVMSSSAAAAASRDSHGNNRSSSSQQQQQQQELQDLLSRISQLESENARLSSYVCSICQRQVGRNIDEIGGGNYDNGAMMMGGGGGALIFANDDDDDEGLVMSKPPTLLVPVAAPMNNNNPREQYDEDVDDGFGEEATGGGGASSSNPTSSHLQVPRHKIQGSSALPLNALSPSSSQIRSVISSSSITLPSQQQQQGDHSKSNSSSSSSTNTDNVEQEIALIVDIQRKIIEKLEEELNTKLMLEHADQDNRSEDQRKTTSTNDSGWRDSVRLEVERMKRELEVRMGGIIMRKQAGAGSGGATTDTVS